MRLVKLSTSEGKTCLSLKSINDAFSSALEEEQAYALGFQTALCGKQLLESHQPCLSIRSCSDILIQCNGNVHKNTFQINNGRAVISSERELVEQLGLALYQALDYGLGEDEERSLSQPLQSLIERMTPPDEETADDTDDEGIGEDNYAITTLDEVLQVCSEHAGGQIIATAHYKNVCRALVAEALELGTFLDQVSKSTNLLRTGDEPDHAMDVYVNIWARVWLHVVKELREGVKLKSSSSSIPEPRQRSFGLTPYEMLMDDIRSRRYNLNKVLPAKVQKDAHALIMEFIRRRPPLKPASERELRPKPFTPLSAWQIVHKHIKQQSYTLKHIIRVETPSILTEDSEKIVEVNKDSPAITINASCPVAVARRIIPADSSLSSLPELKTEIEDDASSESSCNASPVGSLDTQLVPYRSEKHYVPAVDRRHSISIMDLKQMNDVPEEDTITTMSLCPAINKVPTYLDTYNPRQEPGYQGTFLTMGEIKVIRKEMVRAEIDTLRRKPNVTNGKVCFGCHETRFRWYKSNRHKCRLCDQLLCSNCVTTVRVPEEQFGNVPVTSLILPAQSEGERLALTCQPTNTNRAAMYGVLVTVCLECVAFVRLVLQKTAKSRQNFNQALQPEFKLNITVNLSVS